MPDAIHPALCQADDEAGIEEGIAFDEADIPTEECALTIVCTDAKRSLGPNPRTQDANAQRDHSKGLP